MSRDTKSQDQEQCYSLFELWNLCKDKGQYSIVHDKAHDLEQTNADGAAYNIDLANMPIEIDGMILKPSPSMTDDNHIVTLTCTDNVSDINQSTENLHGRAKIIIHSNIGWSADGNILLKNDNEMNIQDSQLDVIHMDNECDRKPENRQNETDSGKTEHKKVVRSESGQINTYETSQPKNDQKETEFSLEKYNIVTENGASVVDANTEETNIKKIDVNVNKQDENESEIFQNKTDDSSNTNEGKVIKKPTTCEKKSLDEIWSKHLHWPEIPSTSSKRKLSTPMPYAISSKKWKEQMEEKNRTKMIPEARKPKSNPKGKSKSKDVKADANGDTIDATGCTLGSSQTESDSENDPDRIPDKSEDKGKTNYKTENITLGPYVIVTYGGKLHPGIVEKIEGDDYEVKAMSQEIGGQNVNEVTTSLCGLLRATEKGWSQARAISIFVLEQINHVKLDLLLKFSVPAIATVKTVLKGCRPITEHDINWNFIHDETLENNEEFEMFINKTQSCLHEAFPTKMLPTRSNLTYSASWMNSELKELRNQLYFLNEFYRQNKRDDTKEELSKFRKKYRSAIIKANNNYNSKIIKRSSNPTKTMWEIINTTKCQNSNTGKGSSLDPNDFNRFFCESVKELLEGLGESEQDPVINTEPNMNNEEFMHRMLQSLEESSKRIIHEANEKQTAEIKEEIRKEIEEISLKFKKEIDAKVSEFELKYTELKQKYEQLETELRKNNIIIFGLETAERETLRDVVIDKVNSLLQLTLTSKDINDIYTIGKQSTKKPIVVKLTSYLMKQDILKKCRLLKGTGIAISVELTLEERQEQKILRQHLKRARSMKLNAFIKNKKLIINGEEYTAQQLSREEEDTDSEEEEEKENSLQRAKGENKEATVERTRTISQPTTPIDLNHGKQGEEEPQDFITVKAPDTNKRKIVECNKATTRNNSVAKKRATAANK
nr:unnamed protein product [Callosobruchus analis]